MPLETSSCRGGSRLRWVGGQPHAPAGFSSGLGLPGCRIANAEWAEKQRFGSYLTVHIGHSCRLGERGLGRELGDGADHEVVE